MGLPGFPKERSSGDASTSPPGLIAMATMADKLSERAVILTPGFHLGAEVQVKSMLRGYDQEEEDQGRL